ncbi:hypothetical protein QO002_001434 [Pararhizobium capsulatum DSM 1112]|uniref:DUF2946 domain-containing protein n=1 Tax=Pararhizobium capsulatum DSM 1112 TaxID=1121113 RepID=A0ABU0BNQ2_9HYPH|nr:hypothetical protein [Pararhizobium capsulatum]MDQ0319296.1 hypothetical protein [Pararhizobium capsulatum DSM 1112]
MRSAVLVLSVLCAILSGWTSALGQTQDLGLRSAGHAQAMHAQGGHDGHGLSQNMAQCDDSSRSCDKKTDHATHPLLCAACYAISVEDPLLQRPTVENRRIAPALQASLRETPVKPRFPPPKSPLFL